MEVGFFLDWFACVDTYTNADWCFGHCRSLMELLLHVDGCVDSAGS
jgi:hypothetical protein